MAPSSVLSTTISTLPSIGRPTGSYLKNGVLVNSDQAGLIHYIRSENSFELIGRRPRKLKA